MKKRFRCNLKRKNIKTVKAGYTVEAALLMPLLIGIIFALCYLTFYLYDINILCGKAEEAMRKQEACLLYPADYESGQPDYENLDRISLSTKLFDKGEMQGMFRKQLQEAVKTDLFIMDVNKVEVKLTDIKRTISLKGKPRLSLAGSALFFPEKLRLFSLELSAWNRNAAEFARGFEILGKNIWN